jgi:hypothetical protein
MTIDERLEKLAERTDAIARNVELLTRLHIDKERRYQERFAKKLIVRLVDTMERLPS